MYINPVLPKINTSINSGLRRQNSQDICGAQVQSPAQSLNKVQITFAGTQKNKNLDTEKETKKLLKQFDDILISSMDPEESRQIYEDQKNARIWAVFKKYEALKSELFQLRTSIAYTEAQKVDIHQAIQYRMEDLYKELRKNDKPFVPVKPLDKNIDPALVNNFKTAILEDNFNLDKVYFDYYNGLNEISSVEELKKKYPKIKIPSKAQDVVADKIISVLTRDFFEVLDKKMAKGNVEDVYNFCDRNIKNILTQSVNEPEYVYAEILETVVTRILEKHENLNRKDSYSTLPQYRKNLNANITENDLKLLAVDYDDFVLSVLRQQYLERKKPYEIKFTDGNIIINLPSLKENSYKFEKPSERIKTIINTAGEIQAAKRNYENFDSERLRDCLNNAANREIGNVEDVFDRIVMFDSCNFAEGDRKSIVRFLQILDAVSDGDLSESEALKIIKKENLRPVETEKINEIKKQKISEALRIQQKQAQELTYLKTKFDAAMNVLYQYDMSGTAMKCAKYRPENLTSASVQNAEFIIQTAAEENMTAPDSVKNTIKHWDTYNCFKTSNPDSEILKKAEAYAKHPDGGINFMKAGRYISNSLTVLNAPKSLEGLSNKDFVREIISRSMSEEEAVKYLCKYDEYNELNSDGKTHLQSYIDLFNLKDPVDKFMLKNIIENDYINTDTVSQVELNDNSMTTATISAKAKQQILDKYKFPGCLEFMCSFEKALTTAGADKGMSGIKKITKNNKAMEYKMELKIINHDDRLFASNKEYYFDVFSDKGLH